MTIAATQASAYASTASPAAAKATASAWGRPAAFVQPRPTTLSFLIRIAPTAGLGRLSGRPRPARAAARWEAVGGYHRLFERAFSSL